MTFDLLRALTSQLQNCKHHFDEYKLRTQILEHHIHKWIGVALTTEFYTEKKKKRKGNRVGLLYNNI